MKSVSSLLLLIMLTISIIGMGLIAIFDNMLASKVINEQSLGRVGETTALSAAKLNSWLEEQIRYIDAVAADFSAYNDISPEAVFPELMLHAENNSTYFAVYIGYPNGSGIFNDKWEPDYNTWQSYERDWYKGAIADTSSTYVTDIYMDADTKELCLTISRAIMKEKSIVGVVAVDIFANVLKEEVNNISVGKDSYAFLTDAKGNIMVHRNSAYAPTVDEKGDTVFQNISRIENGHYIELANTNILQGNCLELNDADNVLRYYTGCVIDASGWILYTSIPAGVVNEPIKRQLQTSAIVFLAVLLCATTFTYIILKRKIVRPIKDITEAASLLARGEIGMRLEGRYTGELALLANSFYDMENFSRQQTEWLEGIAAGDLSIDIQVRGAGDRTGLAIASMLKNLNDMFSNINSSARQVAIGSGQISDGAQNLALGATEQTATVTDLSGAISDIAQKTEENASKAGKAAELSSAISKNAEQGAEQLEEMMQAVQQISESSQNVKRVIKVIDEIAFQTNILALNAAVEAARAGQHGKGFAVVAEEVRSLAAKSAEAAQDTGVLIEDSIEKADMGARIAIETAQSLTKIVESIKESTRLVEDIAHSSEKQSAEIQHINKGISQVAHVIQQNSATAKQSAAASLEMSTQSDLLNNQISHFKLDNSQK
ncbi:MAG: methyl-accepting chemotaxis protein [Firmicutes bacterium]|nr:methyl-accepting chemotaxis protein [Bacillota bacterium]